MKALLLILFGFVIACAGGYGFLMAHAAGEKAFAFCSLLAAASGIIVFLIGLVQNHNHHIRRH